MKWDQEQNKQQPHVSCDCHQALTQSEAMKLNYDDAKCRLRKVGSMQGLQGPDDINNEDNLIYFFIGHCRPPGPSPTISSPHLQPPPVT